RKEAGVRQFGEPWEQVKAAETEALLKILGSESVEIAAVLLSKLDVGRAAELLSRLPGATARRITYAMSQTSAVTPEAVDRIGLSLAAQLHDVPDVAFNQDPEHRVGAILNYSAAGTRDEVLTGLEEADEDFAAKVRKAIFTFNNIADRVQALDVPKIVRELEQERLVLALGHGLSDETGKAIADFILDNMSKRMAETIREEIQEGGKIKRKDGEAAQTELVNAIRELEANGEIVLVIEDEDDEEDA
ncbi:MAG: FliG C-terminal domain-containing protein, partial [Pseudomonadota bacterium]